MCKWIVGKRKSVKYRNVLLVSFVKTNVEKKSTNKCRKGQISTAEHQSFSVEQGRNAEPEIETSKYCPFFNFESFRANALSSQMTLDIL